MNCAKPGTPPDRLRTDRTSDREGVLGPRGLIRGFRVSGCRWPEMPDEFDRLVQGILEKPAGYPSKWDVPPAKWVEPSWEWVDGDPVHSAQFSVFQGALIASLSLTVFGAFLNFLGLLTGDRATALFDTAEAQVLLLSTTGASLLLSVVGYSIPKRVPVVRRLGISRMGLRMVMGLGRRGYKVWWGEVSRVGPDFLEITRGLFPQRIKLTPYQAQRLVQFLQARSGRLPAAHR